MRSATASTVCTDRTALIGLHISDTLQDPLCVAPCPIPPRFCASCSATLPCIETTSFARVSPPACRRLAGSSGDFSSASLLQRDTPTWPGANSRKSREPQRNALPNSRRHACENAFVLPVNAVACGRNPGRGCGAPRPPALAARSRLSVTSPRKHGNGRSRCPAAGMPRPWSPKAAST